MVSLLTRVTAVGRLTTGITWLLLALTVGSEPAGAGPLAESAAHQSVDPSSGRNLSEPLEIGPAAREWLRATGTVGSSRRVLATLAVALLDRGWEEDPDLTLPAGQAFDQRGGNCVSFAMLLAGLARTEGVEVTFVIREAEGLERRADLEISRAHLAVGFRARDELLVYDLSGEHRSDTAEYRPVSDDDALGIFHSNRGAALVLEGELARAILELREATRRAPELALTWVNLGVALRRAERMVDAEAAYRRAIALSPESASAWKNLALLLEDQVGH